MKKTNYFEYPFEIQLFSEGEGSGDAVSADAGQVSSGECDTDTDNEFASLIKGKYKDAFGKKTQSIINRRFKETKELEEYKAKAETVFSFLKEKYGDFEGDFDALLSRMKESEGGASEAAESETAERENKAPDTSEAAKAETAQSESEVPDAAEKEKQSRRERAGALYARWQREGEKLRELYPDFDLETECKGGEFLSLLAGGASVRSAYHAVHHDRIMKSAMEYTAKTVSEAMSRNIAKIGARPFENGLDPRGAVNPAKDVNSLTDSDIAEIIKAVAKGKVIRF